MAKSMISCVMDLGKSMRETIDSVPKYVIASSLVQHISTHMALSAKSSEISVVTFGGPNNENRFNYPHIHQVFPMTKSSPLVMQALHSEIQEYDLHKVDTSGSLVDSLEVGLDILLTVNENKKYTRVLLIITDGENPIDKFEKLDQLIIPSILQYEIKMYVAYIGSCHDFYSSDFKKDNAMMYQSLVKLTHGKFIQSNTLSTLCSILHGVPGLSTTPRMNKISLQIHESGIKIPCTYFNLVSKSSLPSLKKMSKNSMNQNPSGVKRDISYYNPEDLDEEITVEQRVKGYKYGSQYIPIASTEEELFKLFGDEIIELLGFLSYEKIPRYQYMGYAMTVQGDSKLISAQMAMIGLYQVMCQQQKVALVRFVKKSDADPILAVLIPHGIHHHLSPSMSSSTHISTNMSTQSQQQQQDGGGGQHESEDNIEQQSGIGTFLMYQLPCIEDIRNYDFPPLLTPIINKATTTTTTTANETDVENNGIGAYEKSSEYQLFQQLADSLSISDPSHPIYTNYSIIPNPALTTLHTYLLNKLVPSNVENTVLSSTSSSLLDPSQIISTLLTYNHHINKNADISSSSSSTSSSSNGGSSQVNKSIADDTYEEYREKIAQLNEAYKLKPFDKTTSKKRQYWSTLTGANATDGNTSSLPTVSSTIVTAVHQEEVENLEHKKKKGQIQIKFQDEDEDEEDEDEDEKEEEITTKDQTDTTTTTNTPSSLVLSSPLLTFRSSSPREDYLQSISTLQPYLSSPVTSIEYKEAKVLLTQVNNTLQDIIYQRLVVGGGTVTHYRRAIDCLQAYREICIQYHLADSYNAFLLNTLKKTCQYGKHEFFFTYMKTQHISLISMSEDSQSSQYTTKECIDLLYSIPSNSQNMSKSTHGNTGNSSSSVLDKNTEEWINDDDEAEEEDSIFDRVTETYEYDDHDLFNDI